MYVARHGGTDYQLARLESFQRDDSTSGKYYKATIRCIPGTRRTVANPLKDWSIANPDDGYEPDPAVSLKLAAFYGVTAGAISSAGLSMVVLNRFT